MTCRLRSSWAWWRPQVQWAASSAFAQALCTLIASSAATGSAAGIQHFLVGSVTATGAVVCRKAISEPDFAPLDEMRHARTRQLEVRVDRLEARLEQQEAELAELRRVVG